VSGKYTISKLGQLFTIKEVNAVIEPNDFILLNFVQFEIAYESIDVTDDGNCIFLILIQPSNACEPIDYTVFGIKSKFVRFRQLLNAYSPIAAILPRDIIVLILLPLNALFPNVIKLDNCTNISESIFSNALLPTEIIRDSCVKCPIVAPLKQ
jgi:hypothetical protein